MEKKLKLGEGAERFIDGLGEILAFLTVALWVFMFFQYTFGFISETAMVGSSSWTVIGLLEYIKIWATLLVLGLKGFEFALKRGIIIFIIYAVLIAACVIFMFIPNVWESLFGVMPEASAMLA